jgi:large subunit ribosomal protein L1
MGKKYEKVAKLVDREKKYTVEEAFALLPQLKVSEKYDESVDMAVRLGVDPKQSDQMIRGAVNLPHGTGKKVRVAVFAKGDKAKEATEAGADIVGAEDLMKRIKDENFFDFDSVVATPDLMGLVGQVGRQLGPRGLMPNPKVGTVTFDVAKTVKELKGGRLEFRTEKAGVVHARIGKRSFSESAIAENASALIQALVRAKPSTAKGTYLRSISMSSTMGPGVKVDPAQFMGKTEEA